ncbi:MAG TPA: helix-hairpin-helix domain-containing protein, partial [Chloroflexi bacterium]|nr:helix-hairpin-helix domain-containing protein [Chloroflexota bacterium]
SATKIEELHLIGPHLAEAIVKHRETKGYFRTWEDLAKVKGIGEETACALEPQIDWLAPGDDTPANNKKPDEWQTE